MVRLGVVALLACAITTLAIPSPAKKSSSLSSGPSSSRYAKLEAESSENDLGDGTDEDRSPSRAPDSFDDDLPRGKSPGDTFGAARPTTSSDDSFGAARPTSTDDSLGAARPTSTQPVGSSPTGGAGAGGGNGTSGPVTICSMTVSESEMKGAMEVAKERLRQLAQEGSKPEMKAQCPAFEAQAKEVMKMNQGGAGGGGSSPTGTSPVGGSVPTSTSTLPGSTPTSTLPVSSPKETGSFGARGGSSSGVSDDDRVDTSDSPSTRADDDDDLSGSRRGPDSDSVQSSALKSGYGESSKLRQSKKLSGPGTNDLERDSSAFSSKRPSSSVKKRDVYRRDSRVFRRMGGEGEPYYGTLMKG